MNPAAATFKESTCQRRGQVWSSSRDIAQSTPRPPSLNASSVLLKGEGLSLERGGAVGGAGLMTPSGHYPSSLAQPGRRVQLAERRVSGEDTQRGRRLWSIVAMTLNVIGYFFVFLFFFLHVLYIEIKSKALPLCRVWSFWGSVDSLTAASKC